MSPPPPTPPASSVDDRLSQRYSADSSERSPLVTPHNVAHINAGLSASDEDPESRLRRRASATRGVFGDGGGDDGSVANDIEDAAVAAAVAVGLEGNEAIDNPDALTTLFGRPITRANLKELKVVVLMVCVIATGAFNRVANKIMTQPMRNYSFFLSLFNAAAYVLVYFGILLVRYKMGRVPIEHLRWPWRPQPLPADARHSAPRRLWAWLPGLKYFVCMGCMDGLGNILGLIATPHISGPMSSLMVQVIIVFSMICAIIMLGTRYTLWQCYAALVVLIGATFCIIPEFEGNGDGSSILFLMVQAISSLPNAISFTIRELVFMQKKDLDIFIVNSHGSLFQLLLFPIFLPLTLLFKQTKVDNGHGGKVVLGLGEYIRDGFSCFAGTSPITGEGTPDCSTMPWPYVGYIVCNLLFNISLLLLLKEASALLSFMCIKAILPISVLLFYIHWPLIDATKISPWLLGGLVIVLTGLVLFRLSTVLKKSNPRMAYCCSTWLPHRYCPACSHGVDTDDDAAAAAAADAAGAKPNYHRLGDDDDDDDDDDVINVNTPINVNGSK